MKASTRSGRTAGRPAGSRTRTSGGRSEKRTGVRKTRSARSGKKAAGSRAVRTGTRRTRQTRAGQRRRKTGTSGRVAETFVSQNRLSMFLAGLVVVVLLVVVSVNAVSLNRKLHENRARAKILRQEIRTEDQRAADIEEYRRYTETDAYIEEIAREKLGLIYEGETVFKEEK